MEYRKLISFGKSSFVISLPKAWIKQNNVKKGDLIYLEESGSNIILSRTDHTKELAEKKIIIHVDNKPLTTIRRELISAYILNNRTIVFKGKDTSKKFKQLQSLIQNLIALEIMEQNPNTILAKDFLNMDKVSLSELIRKMDLVLRTMMIETSNIFVENNYETLNERDADVNRLYFLLKRVVLYNLIHPVRARKNHSLSPSRLLNYQFIGFFLEGLADETRRTARYLKEIDFSIAEKKELDNIFSILNDQYLKTMKSVYSEDISLALENSQNKVEFYKLLEVFETKFIKKSNVVPEDISKLSKAFARLIKSMGYIHNLGRVVYTS